MDWLLDGDAPAHLLRAALMHDLGEYWMGDAPAPAKRACEVYRDAHKALESSYLRGNGVTLPALNEEQKSILKAADYLDLILKCGEELEMGNTAVIPIIRNGMSYLEDIQLPQHVQKRVDIIMREFSYE